MNIRPFGEKMSARGREDIFRENLRVLSSRRVVESRMTTVTGLEAQIAKYLLHGDHMASLIVKGHLMAEIAGSHDAGTPHTTLVKGRACSS